MSALDRILLVILSLAGVGAGIVLLSLGIGVPGDWSAAVFNGVTAFPGDVYAVIAGIVLILLGVRFLFYRIGGARDGHAVVLSGDHGSIRISFDTVRELANRTGQTVRGVHDLDTRVRGGQTGVLLSIRVRALPDVDLAQMSAEIQRAVKSYVEQTAGVGVEKVFVHVVSLAGSPPPVKSTRAWVE
ncbi:hypothetical protein GCM10010885_01990 [Alicyclobacillus cellulosilyticus]|uniref:Alkaline shock family protein YloU n=1 Tax=Alicyclobacillus cellulosilyticus TaxID=1003997 RepID=A0A917NGH1_9BACL|nr:alkaline shock response membrane anchor protein AmaP [Alicyclobacillus cellulosilyticus]GGI95894.1 hypothetical protein GCM10010885_01990 [Alicyclobacillus cellulosilyticus]